MKQAKRVDAHLSEKARSLAGEYLVAVDRLELAWRRFQEAESRMAEPNDISIHRLARDWVERSQEVGVLRERVVQLPERMWAAIEACGLLPDEARAWEPAAIWNLKAGSALVRRRSGAA